MWCCSLRRGEGGLAWLGLDGMEWNGEGWNGTEKEDYGLRLKRWMKLWSYDWVLQGS